jgi:hypothetical protein
MRALAHSLSRFGLRDRALTRLNEKTKDHSDGTEQEPERGANDESAALLRSARRDYSAEDPAHDPDWQ